MMALFVLTLLAGLGTALLFLTQTEVKMGQASLRSKKAFFLAEAGLEDGRRTLFEADADLDFTDDLGTAAGPDGVIDFDPATLRATYDSSGNVTGLTGHGDDVPLRPLTALHTGESSGWYAAFLTNDPPEGKTVPTDVNRRVIVTGVGAGEDRSVEIVQAVLDPFRYLPPIPPAAITMLGPTPAFFDNGNSNAQEHTGNDCGVAGGAFAPIVGTVSPESRDAVQASINRPEKFSSGPLPFTGEDTVADLTTDADPIVAAAGHGLIDPAWRDCLEVKATAETLRAAADHYCNTDDGGCTFPATGPDSVIFVDGDLSSTPAGSFSGVLVVTGELTYTGNTVWNGVVMVIGEGRIIRSGGGNGNPSGGLIIAAVDPSPDGPAADWGDWCSTGIEGFEQAYYDTSGGGDATVQWCSSDLAAANSVRTYRVVDFLQR